MTVTVKLGFLWMVLAVLLGLLTACYYYKPITDPIRSEYYNYNESSDTLILLFPGIGEAPDVFNKYDVVDYLHQCWPSANILGVDAHLGYYRQRNLIQRLNSGILAPAVERGQRIWLMGNSLGGLGSLLYARRYPNQIDKVFLMAPYLGDEEEFLRYLRQSDSDGNGSTESLDPNFVSLWDALTGVDKKLPEIALAYGTEDKFALQLNWLSAQLDPASVITAKGKHHWKVWRELWPRLLQSSADCAEVGG